MTPARKAALQWFHDRGEVGWFKLADHPPSKQMIDLMIKGGQLQRISPGGLRPVLHSLTDLGRRMLTGDIK